MANTQTVQVLTDGSRSATVNIVGFLDTSDLAYAVLLDPATLTGINLDLSQKASTLKLEKATFVVESPLTLRLYWDATVPAFLESFVGRGCGKYREFGGLTNNAGAGKTGKIGMSTQGWTAGTILDYSLVLEFSKVQ